MHGVAVHLPDGLTNTSTEGPAMISLTFVRTRL